MPRIRKEKNIRIGEIQKAAREVFFDKGFANTTMEEIAKKADVSKGTIYLYFKNKDELYVSLMMPVLEELGRNIARLEKKVNKSKYASKHDFILDLYDAHRRTYEFDPEGIRVIQAFQQRDFFLAMSKDTIGIVNKRAIENYNITRRCLSKIMEAGLIKAKDPLKLADILWAMFMGVVQLESSKLMATGKDHVQDTLLYSFLLLSDGI